MEKNNYENVYVAFLDILGFKDLVEKNSHDILQSFFDSIVDTTTSVQKSFYEIGINTVNKDDLCIELLSVSDSIVIWTKEQSNFALLQLILFVNAILSSFMERGVPLRGAISCGSLCVMTLGEVNSDFKQKNVYGKGIVSAYSLESIQQWSGCIVDEKCIINLKTAQLKYSEFIDLNMFMKRKLLNEYLVPLKSGPIKPMYVVNWPVVLMKKGFTEDDILESFSKHNKKTDDWSVRNKIDNTMNFYKYVIQQT